jgi:hypothetical protein
VHSARQKAKGKRQKIEKLKRQGKRKAKDSKDVNTTKEQKN